MQLRIKYLQNYKKEWGELSRAHPSDAGIDLRAAIDKPLVLLPSSYCTIPLGIMTQFDEGYEAQLRARSGLASKKGIGLVNGVGTIDAGYRGEWAVVLYNYSVDSLLISPGDRICQVVFNQLPVVEITHDPITNDDDRCGGFGSSGVA